MVNNKNNNVDSIELDIKYYLVINKIKGPNTKAVNLYLYEQHKKLGPIVGKCQNAAKFLKLQNVYHPVYANFMTSN